MKMCSRKTIAHWTDMKECYVEVMALLCCMGWNENVFAQNNCYLLLDGHENMLRKRICFVLVNGPEQMWLSSTIVSWFLVDRLDKHLAFKNIVCLMGRDDKVLL